MECRLPSQNPPGGLSPEKVPQFVVFGFDDNGYSGLVSPNNTGGIAWAAKLFASKRNPAGTGNPRTFDGAVCHASFYFASMYISGDDVIDPPAVVKKAWHDAVSLGHEPGNHSHSHPHGSEYSVEEWLAEIRTCGEWLSRPLPDAQDTDSRNHGAGIDPALITGFRATFLEYNDNVLTALKQLGFIYDCSIEEGFEKDQNGTDFFWPYTLDSGSPGHEAVYGKSNMLSSHPGLWEIPIYAATVPPDTDCENYGVPPGLRKKVENILEGFDETTGKISGLDWNLFVEARMTKDECLATLKHSLDLRLKGNRCPFILGCHSDLYSPGYIFPPNAADSERRETLEEFLTYALCFKEVRIVSMRELLTWLQIPARLS